MQEEKKLVWADNLRALATVAVILLHVTAALVYQYKRVPTSYWWLGHLCNSAVRFCVPVFLMLTGALMLPKTYEIRPYLSKRFTRILLPFIFWSIIYVFFNWWLLGKKWHFDEHFLQYCFKLLRDGAMFHLWYIYTIIGIYLFLPMMSKWVVNSSINEVAFYVGIWLIVLLFRMPTLKPLMLAIDWMYFSGYLGFLVLGYWLNNIQLNSSLRMRWLGFGLFVIGVAITMVATFMMTQQQGKLNQLFYAYTSPNVVLAAVGVFLWVKHSVWSWQWIQKIVQLLSRYSYGIYLSHALVLVLLNKAGLLWSWVHPLLGIPVTTVVCAGLSLGITYLLHKIPYGMYRDWETL